MAPLIRKLATRQAGHVLAGALAHCPYPFFLDSGMHEGGLGRFSFLGCDPFLVLRGRGRALEVVDRRDAQDAGSLPGRGRSIERPYATDDRPAWHAIDVDPFNEIERLLRMYTLPKADYPVPFVGGVVGYLAYDLGRLVERLPGGPADDLRVPDLYLCFYDAMVAADHEMGATYLISTGLPEAEGKARQARAGERARCLRELLEAASPAGPFPPRGGRLGWGGAGAVPPSTNLSREAYLRAVRRAREYIVAGDIYQVNLSQRFQAPWKGPPWDLYQRLRAINPAPFAAYQDLGDMAVVSASPERFLRLAGDSIETRPIKGTRPRGRTPEEDHRLARELLASEKDRAEHIMIVDLERNDLGRVSRIGTVSVDQLMALERYATVLHLTSTVRGRLRSDRGLADLLRATFPGGSITGAPKIRAMEIIDELEPTRRGVYTGAIGYLSFTGDLDLNIAIRTIVVKDGLASYQVGGAIVYDSDPAEEYQETLDKGRALMEALAG